MCRVARLSLLLVTKCCGLGPQRVCQPDPGNVVVTAAAAVVSLRDDTTSILETVLAFSGLGFGVA